MKKKQTIINGFICKTLYLKNELRKRVNKIANQIAKDYKGVENITILIITNGGVDFGLDLSRALEKLGIEHARESITATRYTGDGKGGKKVQIFHKPNLQFENKNIIVIEDLVDKGITLNKLHQYLIKQKPGSINYAVIGTKKGHEFNGEINYQLIKGFLPNLWLFGYGMDWAEKHRSTRSIMYNTGKKEKN